MYVLSAVEHSRHTSIALVSRCGPSTCMVRWQIEVMSTIQPANLVELTMRCLVLTQHSHGILLRP